MRSIDKNSRVDLVFQLNWKSKYAQHTDCYQASRANIWRDSFPTELFDLLQNKQSGERIEFRFKAGEVMPSFDSRKLMQIRNHQFERRIADDTITEPRLGRFYPKGMLRGIAGVYRANVKPFRCVALNNGHMIVDFNHPLADKDLILSAIVGKVLTKNAERGGSSVDWLETLTAGPGMQARWQDKQTDYFSDDPFIRDDDQPDALFYAKPRFTQHLDDTAIEIVRNTYGRFLADGMRVLDLMSSWQSHIPVDLRLDKLMGLGLNEKELKKNPQLNDFVVHDLNADPVLPFESDTFDAVVCTVSVEYITHPMSIFQEVARVLRRDGFFILTFSNRWFPTKVIKIWKEIHEFERMGLVLEYFIRSGCFKGLQTYSIRGLPRPRDDKYFSDLRFSDPMFAVWGRKQEQL